MAPGASTHATSLHATDPHATDPGATAPHAIALSVVVPVYGCADALTELHRRLVATLEQAVDGFELIFVDDRAGDGSWAILERLAAEDPRVVALRLSRNFGQHKAITAGLVESRGRRVVVMDGDLQDPPEEIPRLLEAARGDAGREEADIVFALRRTQYQSHMRLWLARLYFWFLSAATGVSIDGSAGSFSLISRKVVDAYIRFADVDRHYMLILKWLGFTTRSVDYERDRRYHGRGSYTFRRLIAHALSGILFQTTSILRWVVYGGLLLSLGGLLLGTYFIVARVFGSVYPGWTSLIVVNLFVGGAVIISVGVVGLYVSKIFDQVKSRPLFVIDRRLARAASPERVEPPVPVITARTTAYTEAPTARR